MLVEFKTVILPLSTALGLSLVVERSIEFLRNVLGYFTLSDKLPAELDKRAASERVSELKDTSLAGTHTAEQEGKAQAIAEKLDQAIRDKDEAAAEQYRKELAEYQRDLEWNEAVPNCVVAWQSASGPNGQRIYNEVAVNALGLALGIMLATIADLKLLTIFLTHTGPLLLPPWLDYILTGLLISAGSGPIHVLMRFISERKVIAAPEDIGANETREAKAGTAQKFIPGADSPSRDEAFKAADWIPIAYEGGVDRERLETVHRRRYNPSLVIFHHTAMHRGATFEDVVRVIKSRKDTQGNPWLTGYNCVVTEDGGIHPFCRWDRYGSHAAGYNAKSLGLAFNGNFETGKSDPYSNHDGRYGPSVPSRVQLEAGARVVALWLHLYKDMKPTFGEGGCVFPHRQIAAKNCPGNMFPTQDFYDLVLYYFNKWAQSDIARAELDMFMRKPYLYV